MSLTDKQARFVEAYLLDPNGKKAAIEAGYSAATAEVAASRLLRHAKVAAALKDRRALLEVRSGVTPERILAELARIGFSDIRSIVEWRAVEQLLFDEKGEPAEVASTSVTIRPSAEMSPDDSAAIAEISQSKDGTLKVKLHDKFGALIRMGQHLGMFRAPASAEPPGKKESAQADAQNAEAGSGWDNLLPGPGSLQ